MLATEYYIKGTHTVGGGMRLTSGTAPLTFEYISIGKEVTILAKLGKCCILSEQNPKCLIKPRRTTNDLDAEVSLDISNNMVTVNYKIGDSRTGKWQITGTLGSWQVVSSDA